MTTYRASVRVEDGVLTTSRPLTAPDGVTYLVDEVTSVLVGSGGDLTAVTVEVVAAGQSDTPIADGVPLESRTPLVATSGDTDDDEEGVAP